MSGARPGICAVGTALPGHYASQEQVLQYMLACHAHDKAAQRRLRSIYRHAQIDGRHSCLGDFAGAENFYGQGEPGTRARMQRFAREAGPLALEACRRALSGASFERSDITHLVLVTCTGFAAPGPELDLVEGLGLAPRVRRLQLGFMGCQAALPALHVAQALCRADPGAVVLVVCVECCTLHFRRAPTRENLVINSLFGDGAAAALVACGGAPRCLLGPGAAQILPEGRGLIGWEVGDAGFRMGLSMAAPRAIEEHVPAFVEGLLQAAGTCREDIAFWVVHPGGRAVLDAVERALDLEQGALEASRQVLRRCGNMSSPSILFALEQVLEEGGAGAGVLLAFGPGLSLEGMVWEMGRG